MYTDLMSLFIFVVVVYIQKNDLNDVRVEIIQEEFAHFPSNVLILFKSIIFRLNVSIILSKYSTT